MHILVVNDDGPPSAQLSPYIHPFVNTLQEAGHLVSVAIPSTSRSWISKAHLRETILKATYVNPDQFRDDGTWTELDIEELEATTTTTTTTTTTNKNKDEDKDGKTHPWAIITNGTPASCTQLGLHNLFPDRPPINLVISGPNHGRNASSIYNLSSGTVGGALEAATCRVRAIALSFGSKEAQSAEVVGAACRLAVRVVGVLWKRWDEGVEVYNVNVPMRGDVEGRGVWFTKALRNWWDRGCLYAEVGRGVNGGGGVGVGVNGDGDGAVNGVHDGLESPKKDGSRGSSKAVRERHFAFAPDLSDMKRGLLAAPAGTDAHTVLNGYTSVTPLTANVSHVPGLHGQLDLDDC